MSEEKIIKFREIKIDDLKKIVEINKIINYEKFSNWFSFDYKITEEENNFLRKIISDNELYLSYYSEQKLSMKFIANILNKIDFNFKDIFEWYGDEIKFNLNGFTLKGRPDFFLAKGIENPKKPFFFLQEYKKSLNSTGNPENQVLAAMLVAINLNNSKKILGGFIIGRFWQFMILEKNKKNNYEYFVSQALDSLKFIDMKQIYINLKAIKYNIKEMKKF